MTGDDAGYALIEEVFSTGELCRVGEALSSLGADLRAGARHLLALPAVGRLAGDSRLVSIAGEFLGTTRVAPFAATLFNKAGRANWLVAWHQDTALPMRKRTDLPGWGPWTVKGGRLYAHAPAEALSRVVALRVHLDASRPGNGPLRVLPGTHRMGRLSPEGVAQAVREIAPVVCLIDAGGVVVLRPLTVHASSKAVTGEPRRVLHIHYAPCEGPGLEVGGY